jgi:DNA-binding NarL/FixJ family response regulator
VLSSFAVICRPRQVDDFDVADETVLQMIAPHLAMALHIHQRLAGADRDAAAAASEDRRPARKDVLMRRYALTAAEADVALEIARGDGRKAAAARLGIAETTAHASVAHLLQDRRTPPGRAGAFVDAGRCFVTRSCGPLLR